jgi:methyl-accepting chemotaxis protein
MISVFSNLKLSAKMMLAPLVVLIFLAIIVLGALRMISMQNSSMDDIYNKRFKGYKDSSRILIDAQAVQINLHKSLNLIQAGYDSKKVEDLLKQQSVQVKQTSESLKTILDSKQLSKAERENYKAILESLLVLQRKADFFAETAISNPPLAVMAMVEGEEAFQDMNKKMNSLHALEDKLSKDGYESSIQSSNITLRIFLILVLVAVIMSVLTSIGVTRMVSGPIKDAIAVLRKVADGDLTQTITTKSHDEIGELIQSVNQMRMNMGHAVGKAMVISDGLSDGSSQEAAALEETSASLDEIASMTKRNAENTEEANQLMMAAKEAIKKANQSMSELTVSMKDINKASEQTQKIVKSIDEIAFQTNLLALNAAVEAARAGESGAGFAVVAGEVRNLAMRATESAKNSSNLIADIVSKVKGGEKLVTATDSVFAEVTSNSEKVSSLMGEIASASHEQSQGIEQVNKAMADISVNTQRTAANAENLTSVMSMFKTEICEESDEINITAKSSAIKQISDQSSSL